MDDPEAIRWPERFDPRRAPVFVSNEIVAAASPEAIWARLINAPRWPHFYSNSADVVLDGDAEHLAHNMHFRWRTFGLRLRTQVTEFEHARRVSWLAKGLGVEAYHAWLLTPTEDGGCRILTQETQWGWLARLGKWVMPNRMYRQHQHWLEGLASAAQAPPPPARQ